MRMLVSATVILLFIASHLGAADGSGTATWYTRLDDAIQQSQKTGHPILMDFSGSDWCDKCRQLKTAVFDTPAFAAWADQAVVLLSVDLPMASHQPADIRKQNDALAKRFSIDTFPGLLIVGPDLAVRGRITYVPGGPEQFIAACTQQLAVAAK